jgi:chromosomal replication initiation ATPase DnaA
LLPVDPLDEDPAALEAWRKWEEVLAELQLRMTHETFNTYLKPTYALELQGHTLHIEVDNVHTKDWLDNRLSSTIQRALATIDEKLSVEFLLPPAPTDDSQQS